MFDFKNAMLEQYAKDGTDLRSQKSDFHSELAEFKLLTECLAASLQAVNFPDDKKFLETLIRKNLDLIVLAIGEQNNV